MTSSSEKPSFNPRSREGSDANDVDYFADAYLFQSTLPRRERLFTRNFPSNILEVSIHAPAKGATKYWREREEEQRKFQSTLPRRERQGFFKDACSMLRFQSTLPRRERPQFQPKIHSNFQQKSTNYHFIYLVFPFSHSLFSIIHFICAHFRVRIPRHFHVRFLFALLYYHKINVSSTAIPRSTPICSTFV